MKNATIKLHVDSFVRVIFENRKFREGYLKQETETTYTLVNNRNRHLAVNVPFTADKIIAIAKPF